MILKLISQFADLIFIILFLIILSLLYYNSLKNQNNKSDPKYIDNAFLIKSIKQNNNKSKNITLQIKGNKNDTLSCNNSKESKEI